jgi:hypothetical protein
VSRAAGGGDGRDGGGRGSGPRAQRSGPAQRAGRRDRATGPNQRAATPPLAPPLDAVQRWFQAVVTHPGGVVAGAGSGAAQDVLPLARLDRGALEQLVRRSSRLTAEERLAIYANAYYARLLECLREVFPVLVQVLGAEAFDGFAFDYLQRYPSRSYTLDHLAESFPRFLEETRPDRPAEAAEATEPAAAEPPPPGDRPQPAWPDFLIDMATLELAIAKVFDGPGAEGEPLLAPADLLALGSGAGFAAARLAPVPCLRLLRFRYPVNAFYTAARARRPEGPEGPTEPPPFPEPAVEHVAISRTDFVVRRYDLSPFEFGLLSALLSGATAGEAIAAATAASELSDDELAAQLDGAFRRWTAAGFFRALAAPPPTS